MMGTINCVYETPCGWCFKWDKKCDKKMYTQSDRVVKPMHEAFANTMCQSDADHEWECCGISTAGTDYVCKKCHAYKTYPVEHHELSIMM